MTELLDQEPDDVEEVLISWLSPLFVTAMERENDDPLPFILIRHIDGEEDPESGTADFLVTIRTLCDRGLGPDAAAAECRKTHRRMLLLARNLDDVPLSNGRNATIDYVKVAESPRWEEYDNDQTYCKRARYTVGLSYSPAS